MQFNERRRYPRIPVKAEVEYLQMESADAELLVTASRNLSIGGACIITFKEFPCGTKLLLHLKFPDNSRVINAEGRVVWVRNLELEGKCLDSVFELGIEFTNIPEEDYKIIQGYVASKLKDSL